MIVAALRTKQLEEGSESAGMPPAEAFNPLEGAKHYYELHASTEIRDSIDAAESL